MHGVFVFCDVTFAAPCELAVHLFAAAVVLHRAQYAVAVVFESIEQQTERVGLHPGVLVEKVCVAVPFFEHPPQTDVVRCAETHIGGIADYFHGLLLEPFHGAVGGTVVYDEDVGLGVRFAYRVDAAVYPAHPVEGHYDDENLRFH